MSDKGKPKGEEPGAVKKMKAIESIDKSALETIVARVDQSLGYPKVGKAACGCVNVGAGPHAKDEDVKTTTCAVIVEDEGIPFIFVTPDIDAQVDEQKSLAAARIANLTPLPKDVEIVALTF